MLKSFDKNARCLLIIMRYLPFCFMCLMPFYFPLKNYLEMLNARKDVRTDRHKPDSRDQKYDELYFFHICIKKTIGTI